MSNTPNSFDAHYFYAFPEKGKRGPGLVCLEKFSCKVLLVSFEECVVGVVKDRATAFFARKSKIKKFMLK